MCAEQWAISTKTNLGGECMKIYTKTGDEGTTGLFAGPRVSKDHARIEAYGTVDELNASIGVARAHHPPTELDRVLVGIQNDLFAVGAELATVEPEKHGTHWIGGEEIGRLEAAIDDFEKQLPPLTQFILPAGTAVSASLHLARGICRRAERRVVTLGNEAERTISRDLVIYLNRLGDLLFVLSRVANASAGLPDEAWRKPTRSSPA